MGVPDVDAPYGSSPLTRGKLVGGGDERVHDGLIPAHAGKTTQPSPGSTTTTAHPRSRGENPARVTSWRMLAGSSPLTRGKPRVGRRGRARVRLIPAHAGKTGGGGVSAPERPAHPRSRGENDSHRVVGDLQEGSSPLTRGKLAAAARQPIVGGLIPAHAGKTSR